MQKAKSRISADTSEASSQVSQKYFVKPTPVSLPKIVKSTASASVPSHQWLQHYLHHLPTLLLSFPGWVGSWYILTHLSPSQIQNFLVPNLYLPLLISTWISLSFSLAFLTLNSKLAFLISSFLTGLLYFRLQHILLSPIVLVGWGSIWLCLGMYLFFRQILHRRK